MENVSLNLELSACLKPLNLMYMNLQEVISMTLCVYIISTNTVLMI